MAHPPNVHGAPCGAHARSHAGAMSLTLVHSRARAEVDAPAVRVKVHLSGGLPTAQIVGLPEAAVREWRDRVHAALLCAQFDYPQRRITINCEPANLPKDGDRFDLLIALGILAASDQVNHERSCRTSCQRGQKTPNYPP